MTTKQYEELTKIEFFSREFGVAAFARRHKMTSRSVYHWRKKLGLPMFKYQRQLKLFFK